MESWILMYACVRSSIRINENEGSIMVFLEGGLVMGQTIQQFRT